MKKSRLLALAILAFVSAEAFYFRPRTPLGISSDISISNSSSNSGGNLASQNYIPLAHAVYEISKAKTSLQRIFKELKSYICDTHFDASRFKESLHKIFMKITNIYTSIHSIVPRNDVLIKQLNFTKHLYETMFGYAKVKMLFYDSDRKDHKLISKIADINILIMALNDINGNLDLQNEHYATKMVNLLNMLCTCRDNFEDLVEVPEKIDIFFELHKTHAEKEFRRLARQIPINP